MGKTYTCWMCKGTFESTWSEEEAQAEMRETFGKDMTTDKCHQVCEDCYDKLMQNRHIRKAVEEVAAFIDDAVDLLVNGTSAKEPTGVLTEGGTIGDDVDSDPRDHSDRGSSNLRDAKDRWTYLGGLGDGD